MKVLMINVVCGIRSTGRICTDLAVELERQGHEVKIAYGREAVPEQFSKYAVRIGSDFGVKAHALRSRLFDASGLGSRKATEAFIRWVKEYNPDVIHLHNIHGYYINIEVLFNYLRTCGKKIVWTLHDCWSFTGHCAFFDYTACEKWQFGCDNCNQKKEYPARLGKDRSKRNFELKKSIFCGIENVTLVTPSKWLKELVGQSFLNEYETIVINNGIDTDVFKPTVSEVKASYGLADKRIILGVAAVWDRRKGLDSFFKLAHMIDDSYVIVLVGLEKEQIKELPANIIGVERTNNAKELAELYSAAEVFFNPTLEDNYPTTNLEAIACGTPVITYKTGGSAESAEYYGAVVDKNDLNGALEAIKAADFQMKAGFDPDKRSAVKKYIDIYLGLI